MRGKIVFIAVVILCLICSVSIASAQIIKIGTGQNPVIYNNKVSWSDTSGSIHVYDLISKKDTKISSSKASYPAIYSNKLVWHDESSGKQRLTVYDISSGSKSYITQNVDSTSIPKIYGNRIVWSANYNESNYDYSVYLRDISTSTQTKIADGNSPDIYSTKIAYVHAGEDYPQVYLYDIAANKNTLLSNGGDLSNPHIYGNKVIWSDFYTRMGYISMYDLVTGKILDVTSDNAYSGDPSNPEAGDDTGTHTNINGDKIVYAKLSNDKFGNAGVYVYNISTGKSTPVYNYEDGVYTTPDVYGNTIVWGIDQPESGDVTGDKGIYVCDLAAKPVASFVADKVTGTHSLPVTFTYTGTGGGTPNSYYWDFGDKKSSTHALTATHTYTKAGTYSVILKVTNSAGSSTATKTAYIKVK